MNIEEVRQHIRTWVETTLSVPSPLFNNLPPCPYAREALFNNKVDIRCVNGAELLDTMIEIGKTWDDSHELILLVAEPSSVAPDVLTEGIQRVNQMLEAADLVSFCDRPDNTNPKYKVTSANGKYVLAGMQRLANFVQAAKPLHRRNYFERVNKQFSVVERIEAAPGKR